MLKTPTAVAMWPSHHLKPCLMCNYLLGVSKILHKCEIFRGGYQTENLKLENIIIDSSSTFVNDFIQSHDETWQHYKIGEWVYKSWQVIICCCCCCCCYCCPQVAELVPCVYDLHMCCHTYTLHRFNMQWSLLNASRPHSLNTATIPR